MQYFQSLNVFYPLKVFQGVLIKNKNSVLVVYGRHPKEVYSNDVGRVLEDKKLENARVMQYKWAHRDFGKILRETNSKWLLDLHSETPETQKRFPPCEVELKSPYLGTIGWGWKHDYDELMRGFFDKYYGRKEILSYGKHGTLMGAHEHWLGLGLLWYKPFEKSLQLVENLANYLK